MANNAKEQNMMPVKIYWFDKKYDGIAHEEQL